MATVTFEISTAFLTRMRAAVTKERPELAGQSNTVVNEAARVKARQLIRDWVFNYEQTQTATSAVATVIYPTDADIL